MGQSDLNRTGLNATELAISTPAGGCLPAGPSHTAAPRAPGGVSTRSLTSRCDIEIPKWRSESRDAKQNGGIRKQEAVCTVQCPFGTVRGGACWDDCKKTIEERGCAHGFLAEGGARRCAQARSADVAATCLYLCLGMSVFRSYQYLLKQKTRKP